MSSELAGYAMGKLLDNGALDVFYTPIYMKKNRPAFKLTVLCNEEKLQKIKKIILKETSTIGVRFFKADRDCMERSIEAVETEYGEVRVKVSKCEDIIKIAPEYEDCKEIALKKDVSILEVYNSAIRNSNLK